MPAAKSGAKTSALETYAARLKAWRKKVGWSQEALADTITYSESLVSAIDRRPGNHEGAAR